ncbi:hypothetical protein KP509_28G039000 [Ceratopteris richardii]|uniref:Thioredoxin domain-containing protein n=1 Tax=Ceratopteris richardii TaxID=49495 RepID=A0A8T2RBA7_CERRI|nr:hypothetical protein KP509_28G039000 [Ceratopteris richardii]
MRMLRARGRWKGLRLLSGLSVHPSQSPRLHAIALAQSTATSLESSSPIRPIFSRTFATDASDSSVIAVKNDAEYVSALNLAQENKGVAVVYFTAKWCGP